MNPANIATAADYADAMLTARRAKRVLAWAIILMLLVQLTVFFLVRFRVLDPGSIPSAGVAVSVPRVDVDVTTSTAPTTQSADATVTDTDTDVNVTQTRRQIAPEVLHYFLGMAVFFGTILPIVLAAVLMLILAIMLVGRLIGVSHVTSAFIWCVFLAALLFPWQAFLNNADLTGDFKIPGVLYTWEELVRFARFSSENARDAMLKWARFVGFPVVALIIAMMVDIKSSRGLRMALGEADVAVSVDETTRL